MKAAYCCLPVTHSMLARRYKFSRILWGTYYSDSRLHHRNSVTYPIVLNNALILIESVNTRIAYTIFSVRKWSTFCCNVWIKKYIILWPIDSSLETCYLHGLKWDAASIHIICLPLVGIMYSVKPLKYWDCKLQVSIC